jgi:hypothetical protein
MKRRYSAYGLALESNWPLPGVQRTRSPTVDVTLELDDRPPLVEASAAATTDVRGSRAIRRPPEGGLLFLLASHAGSRAWTMWVHPSGTRIEVRRRGPVALDDISMLVLSSGLPAALAMRGVPILHGCALAGPDGAIAVLGESGAGKSTIAAAAIGRGQALLADDVVALAVRGGGVEVLPGLAQIRLHTDAVRRLGPDPARTRRLFQAARASDKSWVELSVERANLSAEPRRLVAIHVLGERQAGAARIEPLDSGAALTALLRFTHAGYATEATARAAQLPFWARLARDVPVTGVRPAEGIGETGRLVDRLLARDARPGPAQPRSLPPLKS